MSEKPVRIAVPSVAPGGLDAQRSGHFGRCDCFTIVEPKGENDFTALVVENPPHVHGGCLAPVKLLANHDVDAIVVSGIGARPLQGFQAEGIDVLVGTGTRVIESIRAFVKGELQSVAEEDLCGGH